MLENTKKIIEEIGLEIFSAGKFCIAVCGSVSLEQAVLNSDLDLVIYCKNIQYGNKIKKHIQKNISIQTSVSVINKDKIHKHIGDLFFVQKVYDSIYLFGDHHALISAKAKLFCCLQQLSKKRFCQMYLQDVHYREAFNWSPHANDLKSGLGGLWEINVLNIASEFFLDEAHRMILRNEIISHSKIISTARYLIQNVFGINSNSSLHLGLSDSEEVLLLELNTQDRQCISQIRDNTLPATRQTIRMHLKYILDIDEFCYELAKRGD